MKSNKRSPRHKREKTGEKARFMLDNYHWNKEEGILLELMTTERFKLPELREMSWRDYSVALEGISLKGEVLELPSEICALFSQALKDTIGFDGESFHPSDPNAKIFTHFTGKNISKALDQQK